MFISMRKKVGKLERMEKRKDQSSKDGEEEKEIGIKKIKENIE